MAQFYYAGAMSEFEGCVSIVTGGGDGIGRAAARLFAERGARVAIFEVNAETGEESAHEIVQSGGEAIVVATDVASSEQVAAAVDQTVKHFGRLDYAYNNAGISGPPHPIAEMPEEQWRRALDVMLTGVYLCMKYQIPHMLGSGGAIVNCASGAGLIGFPGQAAYVASKHGVIGLTKTAALEYSSQGIRINAICPGTARTQMVQEVVEESPELQAELLRLHPIGRIAEPAEIAEAALWLCTPRSSFVTGTALVVDGGYVAQ